MTDFKAKMHQIRFRRWGSLKRSPDALAGFGGRFAAGEGVGWRRGGKGKGGKWRGGKGRAPKLLLNQAPQSLATPLMNVMSDTLLPSPTRVTIATPGQTV